MFDSKISNFNKVYRAVECINISVKIELENKYFCKIEQTCCFIQLMDDPLGYDFRFCIFLVHTSVTFSLLFHVGTLLIY